MVGWLALDPVFDLFGRFGHLLGHFSVVHELLAHFRDNLSELKGEDANLWLTHATHEQLVEYLARHTWQESRIVRQLDLELDSCPDDWVWSLGLRFCEDIVNGIGLGDWQQ